MYEATHSKPVAYLQQDISPAKYLLCPATKRAEPIQINGSIISRPRLCPASCLLDSVESSYVFKILNNTLHIHATVAVHVLLTLALLVFTYSLYLRLCHYAQHSVLKCVAFYLWSYPIKHDKPPQFKVCSVLLCAVDELQFSIMTHYSVSL